MATMYTEDDLIMISALQHYLFCRRQCALIHIEQVWTENRLTAEGRVLHDRVDQSATESRRNVRTATAIRLRSLVLGLTGVMDMLEFHHADTSQNEAGQTVAIRLPRANGFWRPFPVEYKRGKPKSHAADEVQLCAQACCLEEMLGVFIPAGALFYGQTRRRTDVVFTPELRTMTAEAASRVHDLIDAGITPHPVYDPKCQSCSLLEICQPRAMNGASASQWLESQMKGALV